MANITINDVYLLKMEINKMKLELYNKTLNGETKRISNEYLTRVLDQIDVTFRTYKA